MLILMQIDAEQLEGISTANVNRRDFGILNNNVFNYHGVANEVTLTLEVVAQVVSPEEAAND